MLPTLRKRTVNCVVLPLSHFILSVSWCLLVANKSASAPLVLGALAANALEILMLSSPPVRQITFRLPGLNLWKYMSHWRILYNFL